MPEQRDCNTTVHHKEANNKNKQTKQLTAYPKVNYKTRMHLPIAMTNIFAHGGIRQTVP